MITDYYRPNSLEEALSLLTKPATVPLGGGSLLSKRTETSFAVVDLQNLGLDKIQKEGNQLKIGATATLNALLSFNGLFPSLVTALQQESPLNLRNTATVAGALISCDGRSPFATSMLALDALLVSAQDAEPLSLGAYYPLRKSIDNPDGFLPGKLITSILIPTNVGLTFETIARTPKDRPIVCAALTRWPSGRTRLALGGWGGSPILAMDGNDPAGIESAAKNAYADAGDQWASAEYRSEMAAILAARCSQMLAS